MANMQSVEEFMRRYIYEHIAEEKRQQATHVPFRRRFYSENCDYGSRPGMLEMFQSEKVQCISSLDTKAEVIVTREVALEPGNFYDLRYLLQASGDSWLICEVDVQCCSCNGKPGNDSCPCCHGTGWRDTNNSKVGTAAADQKLNA